MSDTAPPPLELDMVIYPRVTLLDLAGPQAALGFHGRTHLVWKVVAPVVSDTGIPVLPTTTFADCPRNLDVLFVPGGMGTVDAMQDAELLTFLAECGKTARYVTSVCSGALILAAAGLLDGYKAATHWATYDALAALGVQSAHERYIVDRNRNRKPRLEHASAGA
jgi:cyclohexyl-isocyanide hydratase